MSHGSKRSSSELDYTSSEEERLYAKLRHDSDPYVDLDVLVENLRALPDDIAAAINRGDLKTLTALVEKHFTDDCELTTPSVTVVGKQYVISMYEALLESLPDYVLITKKSRIVDNGEVHSKIYFTGTKACCSRNEHLFKPSNCRLVDEIIKRSKLEPAEIAMMRRLEEVIHSNGEKFLIWGDGFITFYYDIVTLKIYKYETKWHISSFKRCEYL